VLHEDLELFVSVPCCVEPYDVWVAVHPSMDVELLLCEGPGLLCGQFVFYNHLLDDVLQTSVLFAENNPPRASRLT